MATLRLLNSQNVQGVLVVAEAATATVAAAATEAFSAAAAALTAAGEVATLETVLPGVLATLRTELGGTYNPRGVWTPDGVYTQNELVSFATAAGVVGLFVAARDVPPGTLPTETYYWTALGDTPSSPATPGTDPETGTVEPPSLLLNLSDEGVLLSPGGSAEAQLEVALVFASADTELVWVIESDEPGLSGLVAKFDEAATFADEAFGDEAPPEETANRALYSAVISATPETPVGTYAARIVARAADWVDEPSSSRYGLRAVVELAVTVKAAPAALQTPTAIYGMSGAAGYTLAEFTKDSAGGGLHLIRHGNVRPNAQGGGWRSDGGFNAALQTPPLTGHSMTGANEVGFIVAGSTGALGKVVAAIASTTQRNDWLCILKSSEGVRLRTSVQTPGGIVTKDSLVVPHGDKLALSTDPATGTVGLHNLSAQRSATLPRPAWAAGGVIATWFAVLRADGSIIAPDTGEVLAATTHARVLSGEARAQNMAALARDYTERAFDPRPEFPEGTRLILPLLPGAVLTDRTFYDPATHDLRLLGDAATGAEGGILTTGAASSGARTDWLPDVTWGESWMVGYLADGFFALPPALCQIALASQNAASAWLKIYPEVAGTITRLALATPTQKAVVAIEGRARHLFVLRYNAAQRLLSVRETYSGQAVATVSIPAAFAGKVGVSLGAAYRGKTAAGTDLGVTEPSATRSGGLWAGTGPFSVQDEEAMTLALGAASSAQPETQVPTPPPDPNPDPPPGGTAGPMIGVADWTPDVLGSGELREVWETRAKPGWLYLPNSRRTNPVGVANGWDKTFEPTAANEGRVWRWDSFNGVRYRRFIGGLRGAYFIGRGMAQISETVVAQAFRATKDLRLLDEACLEFSALYDAARDESGIGTDRPDGYLGFAAGTDGKSRVFFAPDDPRNTAIVTVINGVKRPYYINEGGGNEGLKAYTGIEVALEEGIMVFWMVTALGAHRNAHQFSPTYEPVGKRPATPQYYKAIRDKAIKLYLDTCNKWDDFFRARNDRKQELPLHVRRSLLHSWLCELGAKAAYAMILHGDAWEASPEGQEVARAWKMTFGNAEKVGVQPKVNLATWQEATHPKYGKCVFWVHDLRRTSPSGVKDATGEYIGSNTTKNGVHPNNYAGHGYGVMSFLHEERASFVTREWLQKCANTVLATCDLGITFDRISTESSPTPIPYTMNGGNQVPSLVSPWGAIKSTLGAADSFLVNSAAPSLCAYDTHGELEGLVERHQARYGSPQDYGATSGLLLAAAKREGRL